MIECRVHMAVLDLVFGPSFRLLKRDFALKCLSARELPLSADDLCTVHTQDPGAVSCWCPQTYGLAVVVDPCSLVLVDKSCLAPVAYRATDTDLAVVQVVARKVTHTDLAMV